MAGIRKKIGEILIEEKLITEEQLSEALETQRLTGQKVGQILIDKGFIKENVLYKVLADKLGCKYVDLENYEINGNIVTKISQTLAQKHKAVPIDMENNKLKVAMSEPTNIIAIDDIMLYTNMKVVVYLASERQITNVINKYFGKQVVSNAAEEFKKENNIEDIEEEEKDESTADNSPIAKMLNSLLEQAIRSRASDIHIEPYEKRARVRFRVDGSLKEISSLDLRIIPALNTRVKILGGMNIAERRRPQDGRANFKLDGAEYDLRISSMPTAFGEKTVMRITDKTGFVKSIDNLGFFKEDKNAYDEILKNPNGIILVTGPTGSGKSTTLYATLREFNKEEVNILTVEDPVEATIPGVNQVQVNHKAGVDFANVLRSFLRQDPDIIMVGEIRDTETAEISIQAALTGHLVLSTLHTNDSASAVGRLIDMGIEPFLISTTLKGIVAQRLVKRLCPKCKQEYEPSDKEYECLDLFDKSDVHFYKPIGCNACNNTGYSGRIGVYEVLQITPNIRQLITQKATADEIKFVAMREGMSTIWRSCSKLVANGTTTVDELIRIAYIEE